MKKRFSVGIMAVALAFGIAVSGYSQTDPDLNGTWENRKEDGRIVFDNGNFLVEYDDAPVIKGTFANSSDTITLCPTHIYRSQFGLTDGPEWLDRAAIEENSYSDYVLEPVEHQFFLEGDTLSLSVYEYSFTRVK